ncbi:MAG: hypothetical protein Q8Q49_02045 [bacterium]|nr:hypothetical protein [bacterium]
MLALHEQPQSKIVLTQQSFELPFVSPDIDAEIDNLDIAGDKEAIKQDLKRKIEIGSAVLHAVEPGEMLDEINLRGLGGIARIEGRVELIPHFTKRDEAESNKICDRVATVSSVSLLYDAGYSIRDGPLYGRVAVAMTSDGDWGFVTSVSNNEKQNADEDKTGLQRELQASPLAKIGNARFLGDMVDIAVLINGKLEFGPRAIDALRLRTQLEIRDFMEETPPLVA